MYYVFSELLALEKFTVAEITSQGHSRSSASLVDHVLMFHYPSAHLVSFLRYSQIMRDTG